MQLASKVPRKLRRRVRLHCVEEGRSVQEFVAEALREWLTPKDADRVDPCNVKRYTAGGVAGQLFRVSCLHGMRRTRRGRATSIR